MKASESTTTKPKNKTLWICIGSVIAIFAIVGLFSDWKISSGSVSGRENLSLQEHTIILTTEWSEEVGTAQVGYGKKIVAFMKTPNLYWQGMVRFVGREEPIVYDLDPINYEGSSNRDAFLKEPIESFRYRITPVSEAPENKGRKLTGELRWHTEPVKY